jgi:hypothetical protein
MMSFDSAVSMLPLNFDLAMSITPLSIDFLVSMIPLSLTLQLNYYFLKGADASTKNFSVRNCYSAS